MATVNNQDRTAAAPTGRAHEDENVHTPSIVKFAAGMLVLIGVCIIASIGVLRFTSVGADAADEQAESTDSLRGAPAVPKTRLQIAPEAELQAFARDKAAVLNGYGWVDRGAGRVHIPIARAIELVAQRGLPGFDSAVLNPSPIVLPPTNTEIKPTGKEQ